MKKLQNYVETLKEFTFNKLLKRSEIDTDSTIDHIVMVANYRKYRLVFAKSNAKYEVYEYGYMKKGHWYDLKPTYSQMAKMESVLDTQEDIMLHKERMEAEAMANADMRDTYSFIDANFYRIY